MNKRKTDGFTLVEVLLVILIIGMLTAVLAVTIGGTQERARIDTTKLTIQKVEGLVQQYYMHVGRYPTESDGGLNALVTRPSFQDERLAEKWAGPYARSNELEDAWGNKLNYELTQPGEQAGSVPFRIWSNGPDQQSNTADDISNVEVERR